MKTKYISGKNKNLPCLTLKSELRLIIQRLQIFLLIATINIRWPAFYVLAYIDLPSEGATIDAAIENIFV